MKWVSSSCLLSIKCLLCVTFPAPQLSRGNTVRENTKTNNSQHIWHMSIVLRSHKNLNFMLYELFLDIEKLFWNCWNYPFQSASLDLDGKC